MPNSHLQPSFDLLQVEQDPKFHFEVKHQIQWTMQLATQSVWETEVSLRVSGIRCLVIVFKVLGLKILFLFTMFAWGEYFVIMEVDKAR